MSPALLGNNHLLLGSTPSAANAAVYSFVANALLERLPSPILSHAKAHANLIAYCERCTQLWFADVELKNG